MIKKVFKRLSEALSAPDDADDGAAREEAIRRATAVLMVDVAIADTRFDDRELRRILELVGLRFDLDGGDARELVEMARTVAKDMVSLYEFTQLLHQNLSAEEKAGIVSMLWQVAYADGELDKHEDSLVLKIGDLLHVNRARVMRAKDDARPPAGSAEGGDG